MFYLNYKLRLLEKLLKVKCLFGGKEYPFQNIEPRAFFLFAIYHMIQRHISSKVDQM